MFRTLIFLLIGYLVWTIFRIMQRSGQSRGSSGLKRGYDEVHSAGKDRKSNDSLPEIRDAEFEDIDPRKDDEP